MTMNKGLRIFGGLLTLAGLALLAPLLYFMLSDKFAVVHATPTMPAQTIVAQPSVVVVTGNPIKLSIPSRGMNLQVIDGYYNSRNGEWTLTLDKAQFATPSVEPNNIGGNTLIYGHYRPEVFAYLHLIKKGAQATVTTDNGYVFTYTYTGTEAYNPADTSIFSYQGAPRLTIQTCSGFFMQNRQMYFFEYDGYQKV